MTEIINTIQTLWKDMNRDPKISIPFIVLLLWSLDTLISFFTTGFITIDVWVIISWMVKAGILLGNIYFIIQLFSRKNKDLFYLFKTYAGYCIIVVYVTYAFPRMSWELSRTISDAQAIHLWIFNFISTLFPFGLYLLFWSSKIQHAWGVETEKEQKAEKKKISKISSPNQSIKDVIIENFHILLQAFIIVILIQHFFFQLYIIPSESMVPTILTGDRPIVTKFQSGPPIPLTNWRLPVLKKPARGDIVVFENPHYFQNSLFKKIFHHFVFLATLSLVDIDRDQTGEPKKRYIVKRVIGEPGDKLMMIDDIVYIKTKGEPDFSLFKEDDSLFSHTDLYNEPPEIKTKIKDLIISEQIRDLLTKWDDKKKNTDINDLVRDINKEIASIKELFTKKNIPALQQKKIFHAYQRDTYITLTRMTGLEKNNELQAFDKYFTHPAQARDFNLRTLSLYQKNGILLNLLYDHLILSRFARYCSLIYGDVVVTTIPTDEIIFKFTMDLSEFYTYMRYYDLRNFPVFPEGEDNYIPQGSYFLMGDNRYNSLDFRFSQNDIYSRKIDPGDPFSFAYPSNLAPSLLKEENIVGLLVGRLWPINRFGLMK